MEEELPGGGPHAGLQLEAAEGEVLEGGGQGVGDGRRLVGAGYLWGRLRPGHQAMTYPEYEGEVVGDVGGPPGWLASGHLYDEAAEAPDVAGAPVVVPSQHLHQGGGAQLVLTSGAMKAMVPCSCPWNSPGTVDLLIILAAAPKSAILRWWPDVSTSTFAPEECVRKRNGGVGHL